jgi:hypothetical protein
MLALLVVVCFALAWLLRLGWFAHCFSGRVLLGYCVAVVLIIGQLGKLLGLSIEARDPRPQLWEDVRELGSISGLMVAVAAAALAAQFALRRFMAKVPARSRAARPARSRPRRRDGRAALRGRSLPSPSGTRPGESSAYSRTGAGRPPLRLMRARVSLASV